jgi:hypothetical protein
LTNYYSFYSFIFELFLNLILKIILFKNAE